MNGWCGKNRIVNNHEQEIKNLIILTISLSQFRFQTLFTTQPTITILISSTSWYQKVKHFILTQINGNI